MSETEQKLPDHEYLYGLTKEQVKELKEMKYEEALKYKIECAQTVLVRLHYPHFTKRDTARISRVQKAIKFNEMLLEELKG